MQEASKDIKTNSPPSNRKDFLLEETAKEFIKRFDIEHAFPPGHRPKRKKGMMKRIFDWCFKGPDSDE